MKTGFDWIVAQDMYRTYLRRLDARAVLEHYGAEHCFEQSGGDGTVEIVHSCLLDRVEPHHRNADAHPSACVNVDKKLYVCYALGFGCDLFHLIMKLEGKESFADSLGVIGPLLTGAIQDADSMCAELEKLFARDQGYRLNLPVYDPRILDAWARPHPYWAERGITVEARELLRLGYDERERRIVFPVTVEGKLVGWQKRVIPGETVPEYPKYRNSSGFPKSETLYGLDLVGERDTPVVVESPMSVARAYSVGFGQNYPVLATFGAKVSDVQIDQLKRFPLVYVWFDRDPAGLAGEKKLTEGLYRFTDVLVITPDGGRDMGDADFEEMDAKRRVAVPAALRLAEYDVYRKLGAYGQQET